MKCVKSDFFWLGNPKSTYKSAPSIQIESKQIKLSMSVNLKILYKEKLYKIFRFHYNSVKTDTEI